MAMTTAMSGSSWSWKGRTIPLIWFIFSLIQPIGNCSKSFSPHRWIVFLRSKMFDWQTPALQYYLPAGQILSERVLRWRKILVDDGGYIESNLDLWQCRSSDLNLRGSYYYPSHPSRLTRLIFSSTPHTQSRLSMYVDSFNLTFLGKRFVPHIWQLNKVNHGLIHFITRSFIIELLRCRGPHTDEVH